MLNGLRHERVNLKSDSYHQFEIEEIDDRFEINFQISQKIGQISNKFLNL